MFLDFIFLKKIFLINSYFFICKNTTKLYSINDFFKKNININHNYHYFFKKKSINIQYKHEFNDENYPFLYYNNIIYSQCLPFFFLLGLYFFKNYFIKTLNINIVYSYLNFEDIPISEYDYFDLFFDEFINNSPQVSNIIISNLLEEELLIAPFQYTSDLFFDFEESTEQINDFFFKNLYMFDLLSIFNFFNFNKIFTDDNLQDDKIISENFVEYNLFNITYIVRELLHQPYTNHKIKNQNLLYLLLNIIKYKPINYNLIFNQNYLNDKFYDLFSFIYNHFSNQLIIKKVSVYEFSLIFSCMLWTKNADNLLAEFNRIMFILDKNEQNKFIWWMMSFNQTSMLNNLNLFNVKGLYIKFLGKVSGFGGDQSKVFYVQYGKFSRTNSITKNHYFYKQIVTLNGTIGIKLIISFV